MEAQRVCVIHSAATAWSRRKTRDKSRSRWATARKVVKDHYFEIVDERAAKAYWSIKPLPKGDRKIVAIGRMIRHNSPMTPLLSGDCEGSDRIRPKN